MFWKHNQETLSLLQKNPLTFTSMHNSYVLATCNEKNTMTSIAGEINWYVLRLYTNAVAFLRIFFYRGSETLFFKMGTADHFQKLQGFSHFTVFQKYHRHFPLNSLWFKLFALSLYSHSIQIALLFLPKKSICNITHTMYVEICVLWGVI